jgi:hypothetical protein
MPDPKGTGGSRASSTTSLDQILFLLCDQEQQQQESGDTAYNNNNNFMASWHSSFGDHGLSSHNHIHATGRLAADPEDFLWEQTDDDGGSFD